MMLLNDVASWATILGGVAALVTPLVFLIRVLAAINRRILRIELQHQNNGGATLRDAVDRIETKVNTTGTQLQAHLVDAAGQDARFAAHVEHCGTTVNVHPPAEQ